MLSDFPSLGGPGVRREVLNFWYFVARLLRFKRLLFSIPPLRNTCLYLPTSRRFYPRHTSSPLQRIPRRFRPTAIRLLRTPLPSPTKFLRVLQRLPLSWSPHRYKFTSHVIRRSSSTRCTLRECRILLRCLRVRKVHGRPPRASFPTGWYWIWVCLP